MISSAGTAGAGAGAAFGTGFKTTFGLTTSLFFKFYFFAMSFYCNVWATGVTTPVGLSRTAGDAAAGALATSAAFGTGAWATVYF